MHAWWRVLRGVWPYRAVVIISMICALGVGLSYAAGIGVLMPVLKIFVSSEGAHAWAHRSAVEKRFDVTIWPLGANIQKGKSGIIIGAFGGSTPEPLQLGKSDYIQIQSIVGKDFGPQDETARWRSLIKALATAPDDQPLQLNITRMPSNESSVVTITSRSNNVVSKAVANALIWAVDWLPEERFTGLVYTVLFFIFLCIVGSIFRYYQQFLGMTVANRVIMDLRRRMYDRVVQLPTGYFAQKGTSDLLSRLTQDTNTLTAGVSMAFGKAIQEPIKAVGAFGLAMYLDWKLCLMIILSMPALGIIIHKFSKRMRKAGRRALESWSNMLAIINETLIGVRVVKAYSGEGFERRRFAGVNKKLLKEQIKLNHYGALSRPVIETLAVALSSIPMMFAARRVLNGGDVEVFFTLLGCFAAMLEPIRKLSDVNGVVQQSNAAATRVFEIIDMVSEPNHNHSLPKLPRHQSTIEFRDLTFSYPGHEELVLQNINLTIGYRQNVALVGGNGSGKTTLLSLLPRLYIPTKGSVLIDGRDIGEVSLRSLRKQIGLVTQDTLLFADTIYNNIAYGTRHATREQVMDASRRSYADEFIRSFPEGYETRVGEHGIRLSGGQKQRIAIARAILHDPSILILDEAMSQIDSDSEAKISLALREFSRNRTVLMIAHRFQTVILADMIICLDHGKVAGIGTHAQLIESCLAYRKLYENQFREVSDYPAAPAAGDESAAATEPAASSGVTETTP